MKNTTQVRNIIRSIVGKHCYLATNKYANCRTVKTYSKNWNSEWSPSMINRLKKEVSEIGGSVKIGEYFKWTNRQALIVKLPITY